MTMLRPEKTKSVRLLFSPTELLQIRKSAENASIFRDAAQPDLSSFAGLLWGAGCRRKLTAPRHNGDHHQASFLPRP